MLSAVKMYFVLTMLDSNYFTWRTEDLSCMSLTLFKVCIANVLLCRLSISRRSRVCTQTILPAFFSLQPSIIWKRS